MDKIILKTVLLTVLLTICGWSFGQTNDEYDDNSKGLPPTSVTINAYPPPSTCNGTRTVTKVIAKVKWLWANDEEFKYATDVMEWNGSYFTIKFSCQSCAPVYFYFCLEGYDDSNGGFGVLTAVTSKKVESAGIPYNDIYTVLSNEWNGNCFGASPMIPACDQ